MNFEPFIEMMNALWTPPEPTIPEITLFVFRITFLLIAFQALKMILMLTVNKGIGLTSKPFSSSGNGSRKILILGDSTAVGAGASRGEDTIAGRLAHDFPDSHIINYAQNGGRIGDLEKQIKQAAGQDFDLIIVSAGGNDVWHYTRLESIKKNLQKFFPILSRMSGGRVIFLVYNNIGSAPIFPRIVQWFLKRRCDKVHEIIRDVARATHIPIIDLFSQEQDNPFLKNSENLFAFDGVHPNSRGYEIWYNRMWREMARNEYRY